MALVNPKFKYLVDVTRRSSYPIIVTLYVVTALVSLAYLDIVLLNIAVREMPALAANGHLVATVAFLSSAATPWVIPMTTRQLVVGACIAFLIVLYAAFSLLRIKRKEDCRR